jgi:hypothetical protein
VLCWQPRARQNGAEQLECGPTPRAAPALHADLDREASRPSTYPLCALPSPDGAMDGVTASELWNCMAQTRHAAPAISPLEGAHRVRNRHRGRAPSCVINAQAGSSFGHFPGRSAPRGGQLTSVRSGARQLVAFVDHRLLPEGARCDPSETSQRLARATLARMRLSGLIDTVLRWRRTRLARGLGLGRSLLP